MIDRILVAMDASEMAERALEYALENHPDADITAFHVVGEPSPWMGKAMSLAIEDDLEAAKQEHAESVLDRAHAIASEYDRTIDTDVGMGNPAKAIVNVAGEYDAVVVGSHGGSLVDQLVMGNVAETVFRRAPVPVIVIR